MGRIPQAHKHTVCISMSSETMGASDDIYWALNAIYLPHQILLNSLPFQSFLHHHFPFQLA